MGLPPGSRSSCPAYTGAGTTNGLIRTEEGTAALAVVAGAIAGGAPPIMDRHTHGKLLPSAGRTRSTYVPGSSESWSNDPSTPVATAVARGRHQGDDPA